MVAACLTLAVVVGGYVFLFSSLLRPSGHAGADASRKEGPRAGEASLRRSIEDGRKELAARNFHQALELLNEACQRHPDDTLLVLADDPLTVFGDGSQTRSFCYVDDLIHGLVLLAESGEHFPVNIGNPQELSLLELAQTVIAVTGSKSEIVFEALPVDDPQVRQPDITRARQLLGWEPTVPLEEGLRRTLQANPRESPSV